MRLGRMSVGIAAAAALSTGGCSSGLHAAQAASLILAYDQGHCGLRTLIDVSFDESASNPLSAALGDWVLRVDNPHQNYHELSARLVPSFGDRNIIHEASTPDGFKIVYATHQGGMITLMNGAFGGPSTSYGDPKVANFQMCAFRPTAVEILDVTMDREIRKSATVIYRWTKAEPRETFTDLLASPVGPLLTEEMKRPALAGQYEARLRKLDATGWQVEHTTQFTG